MRTLDILYHLAESVGIGDRDNLTTAVRNLILDYLNIEYEQAYNIRDWDDIKIINFSATTTNGVVTLPHHVDSIRAVRIGNSAYVPHSELEVWAYNPAGFDTAGTVYGYMKLPSKPLLTDATAAGILQFKSSDNTDDVAGSTLTVRIEGEVSGLPTSEEANLNGSTLVPTSTSFDAGSIVSITKPLTTGRITIYAADGTTELGSAGPDDQRFSYKRIQLANIVDTSTTVHFIALRKFERLVSDNDSVIIPAAEAAIIKNTRAELLDYLEKHTAGGIERAKGTDSLRLAIHKEDNMDESGKRVLPKIGRFSSNRYRTNRSLSPTGA